MATTSVPARPTGLHKPDIRRCVEVSVEARGARSATADVRIEGPGEVPGARAQQVYIEFLSEPGDALMLQASLPGWHMIGLLITPAALEALHAALGAAIEEARREGLLVEDADQEDQ